MTTDAGSGFDDQAGARAAAANLDELEEEESRHQPGDEDGEQAGDEVPEEAQERQRVHDEVNDAF